MKKYKIKKIQYFIKILLSSSSLVAFLDAEKSLVEQRSLVEVLMLNPTINPKTLDVPQDPTFQNQSQTHLKR
jgi:hypothetical protein